MGIRITRRTQRRLGGIVAGVCAAALIAAGCSSSAKIAAPTTTTSTTTTIAATTTTAAAAAADTTVPVTPVPEATTAPTEGTPTSETTGSSAPATTPTSEDVDPWTVEAKDHEADLGKTFTLDCTPNGHAVTVWGTETYTNDSSICTAAVQVGLITLKAGGTVEYQIAPGLDSYDGMSGNGVTSESYGSWSGSFIFPKAPPGTGTFTPSIATWSQNAAEDQDNIGKKIAVNCSPKGQLGSVWGTHTYTDDSSICTAAVLEGLITVDKGGLVVVQVEAGQESYIGSTANGVTSQDYPAFGGSFVFPKDQTPPA